MRYSKQIISVTMAALMAVSAVPSSALAAEANTPKEEVVYVNLNTDGSVQEINVVNIFDLDKDGKIIDYGEYENLHNMTTSDAIEYENNKVTIDAAAGKLYYEGTLSASDMPWIISIHYYMDGKEYTADEIAGMSGKLEIKMSIEKNDNCDSSFFEGYALQTTFMLDTNKNMNIIAEGATMANVGSDKQITYTILPNTAKEITISADTVDFEMDAVAINGIRMNLDVEIDESVLQDKISEIIDAVDELDEGSGKLNNGASDLYDATGSLNAASNKIYNGVGSLYNGASDLKKGLNAITSKNKELTSGAWTAYEGLCSAAQTQLNSQLTANGLDPVTLTPETYSKVLLGVMDKMDAKEVYQKAYNTALSEVTAQVEAQADTLYAGYIESQADAIYKQYVTGQIQLMEEAAAMTEEQKQQIIEATLQQLTSEQKEQILQGALSSLTEKEKAEIRNGYISQMMATEEVTSKINEAVNAVSTAAGEVSKLKNQLDSFGTFYNGLTDYTNAVSSAAKGAGTLKKGLSSLYSNTETFDEAVGQLHDAVGTLKDGTSDLKDGTKEFSSQVDGMDTKVEEEIDSMTSDLTGKDIETVSFVSEENVNIKSVQFVIQTENIAVDDTDDAVVEEEESLSFWEKLLQLFKK